MQRPRLWLMLACLLTLLAAPVARADEAELKVQVNGQLLPLNPAPFVDNGRTLVPLRPIFEALGATIGWNAETRTVTGVRGAQSVALTVESDQARVDGRAVTLQVPAKIQSGRTFVPVRFVAEALGAEVAYDAESRTVIVADLNYANLGANGKLLQKTATFRAPVSGDYSATVAVAPATEAQDRGLEATIAGQVRGTDAYFKMDQTVIFMGRKIPQTAQLAGRGGQVYLKAPGETAWQALGAGTAGLSQIGLPGALDPSRPLNTALVGGFKNVSAGTAVTVDGEEYREFTITFDPARLQTYLGTLAAGLGTSLDGVTWQTMQAKLLVRTSDGFPRQVDLLFSWSITATSGQVTPWQLTLHSEWLPAGAAISWPADLPQ